MIAEIFAPYLSFIIFFVTVIVNIYLITKKADWILLIIANLILNIVLSFFGLSPFEFISDIVTNLMDMIGDILWPF